jgi:hypothetical protein
LLVLGATILGVGSGACGLSEGGVEESEACGLSERDGGVAGVVGAQLTSSIDRTNTAARIRFSFLIKLFPSHHVDKTVYKTVLCDSLH